MLTECALGLELTYACTYMYVTAYSNLCQSINYATYPKEGLLVARLALRISRGHFFLAVFFHDGLSERGWLTTSHLTWVERVSVRLITTTLKLGLLGLGEGRGGGGGINFPQNFPYPVISFT